MCQVRKVSKRFKQKFTKKNSNIQKIIKKFSIVSKKKKKTVKCEGENSAHSLAVSQKLTVQTLGEKARSTRTCVCVRVRVTVDDCVCVCVLVLASCSKFFTQG